MPETMFSVHSAAVGTLAVAAIDELPAGVVGEHDTVLAAFVFDDPRLRIGDLAAGRQLQLQESAGAFQVDAAAANDLAALAHGKHGRAIDVVPELVRSSDARHAIRALNCLDFRVGEFIRLEFPPSIQDRLDTRTLDRRSCRRCAPASPSCRCRTARGRSCTRSRSTARRADHGSRQSGGRRRASILRRPPTPATRLSIALKSAPIST